MGGGAKITSSSKGAQLLQKSNLALMNLMRDLSMIKINVFSILSRGPSKKRGTFQKARDLPKSERDLPNGERDLPNGERDLPKSERDLPKSERKPISFTIFRGVGGQIEFSPSTRY